MRAEQGPGQRSPPSQRGASVPHAERSTRAQGIQEISDEQISSASRDVWAKELEVPLKDGQMGRDS